MSESSNVTAAPLNPSSLKPAESSRNVWRVTAAIGTQRKDMLNPLYWQHVSMKLKASDHIEVIAEDGSFVASYYVRNADRTWARVAEMSFITFDSVQLPKEELDKIKKEYEVKFKGEKGWCVIRAKNNTLMHEGCHSKEDGEDWLAKFLSRSVSAA